MVDELCGCDGHRYNEHIGAPDSVRCVCKCPEHHWLRKRNDVAVHAEVATAEGSMGYANGSYIGTVNGGDSRGRGLLFVAAMADAVRVLDAEHVGWKIECLVIEAIEDQVTDNGPAHVVEIIKWRYSE